MKKLKEIDANEYYALKDLINTNLYNSLDVESAHRKNMHLVQSSLHLSWRAAEEIATHYYAILVGNITIKDNSEKLKNQILESVKQGDFK